MTAVTAETAEPKVVGRLASLSLLVVEDDSDTLALYERSLRAAGARVQCARTVHEALSILDTWHPDAVLCDLHLPDFDGYALLRNVLASPRLAKVPVIAISGSHPGVEHDRALQAGFRAHLTKPAKLAEIIAAVTAAIPH
jgi:two-component system CheB/CheR fusion protein